MKKSEIMVIRDTRPCVCEDVPSGVKLIGTIKVEGSLVMDGESYDEEKMMSDRLPAILRNKIYGRGIRAVDTFAIWLSTVLPPERASEASKLLSCVRRELDFEREDER